MTQLEGRLDKKPGHVPGSYEYGDFHDNAEELDRLTGQASVALAMERAEWPGAGIRPGMHVLDLGCGPGVISAALARYVVPGRVTAVDRNVEILRVARARKEQEGIDNLEIVASDAYDLDVGESCFDYVYSRFLFQHLSDPTRVLRNVLRALRPGGRMCVVDVDDGFLTLHPEPVGFPAFRARAARHQQIAGGDRNVGRKLRGLFETAGFVGTATQVKVVTSDLIGIEPFVRITTGFKCELIRGDDRALALDEVEEIVEAVRSQPTWGAVGVFYTIGEKPGGPG